MVGDMVRSGPLNGLVVSAGFKKSEADQRFTVAHPTGLRLGFLMIASLILCGAGYFTIAITGPGTGFLVVCVASEVAVPQPVFKLTCRTV